ncbi:ML domain-containing protein [Streptomyces hundungensis]|uniref:ML domain-containing protein n=1 Tax=Streptomyces hundungensis TaxID=1077946 RepID=UPI003408170F
MAEWTYDDMGTTGDPLQIESITLTPDPPEPGKDLKAVLKANVTEEIADGAYADVVVKLGLIKMFSKRFDLFSELKARSEWSLTADSGDGAPVGPGPVTLTFEARLPKEIPQAKFTVDVGAYTAGDDDLAALRLKISFIKPLR